MKKVQYLMNRIDRMVRGLIPFIAVFFGCLLFTACKKVQVEQNVPLSEVLIEYAETENIRTYTATKEGKVFIIANAEGSEWDRMDCYNAQGEREASYELTGCYMVQAAAADGDGRMVYFTGQHKGSDISLLALHTDTGEMEALCSLSYFKGIKKAVQIDGRIYVLGQRQYTYGISNGTAKDYDFSAKEMLVYYSLEDGGLYGLGFEYPINIAPGEDGKLAVLGYLPDKGYCLMDYDPAVDGMDIRIALDSYRFDSFALCNGGESVVYADSGNMYGLLMADCANMEVEKEVYEYAATRFTSTCAWYAGGRLYCEDNIMGHLVSFPLEAVLRQQDKTLRMLAAYTNATPHACGYALDRVQQDWDRIVLKVLAQDKDYDMCVGDTSFSGSLSMRNSGAFYPLDEVPGVAEYLDRCFPYVKEAATNEDGIIWMIPFEIMMDSLVVQEEMMEETGICLHDNMTIAEFVEWGKGLDEKGMRRIDLVIYRFASATVRHYFSSHAAVDGPFLECLKDLQWLHGNIPAQAVRRSDFVCRQERLGWYADSDKEIVDAGYTVYSLPKQDSKDKNPAVCSFLVVNPNSPNLEDTLAYISDLALYLAGRNDLWYFQDIAAEPGSTREQIHTLYQNAEIVFAIDADVYENDFDAMIRGEMAAEEFVGKVGQRLRIYLGE